MLAHPSEVAARSAETADEAYRDWIGAGQEGNWGGFGRRLCCKSRGGIEGGDHRHVAPQQFARQRGRAVVLTLSPAPFDANVVTFDKAGVPEPLDESGLRARECTIRRAAQNTDHPSRFLCACGGRPRGGATEKRDEVATPHWRSPRLLPTGSCPLQAQYYQY